MYLHKFISDTVSAEQTEPSAEATSAVTTPAVDEHAAASATSNTAATTGPKSDKMAVVRGVWSRFLENALLV